MERARGGHDGGVESAAAQVVDEDCGALGIECARMAVRVLETCGRRLVDHREDVPSRAVEGLKSQEALC